MTVSVQSSAAAVNQAVSPQGKELNVSSKEKLFGRYEDKWLGEVSLCKTNVNATLASRFSPRFQGRLLSIKQERIAILWDHQALNSDAIIVVAKTRDSPSQRFTLAPLAEADFNFGAMDFIQIGACS